VIKERILQHLQSISTLLKQVRSHEYQLFCPYCNDAHRKPNPRHGHLYVLIDTDTHTYLFHCFRCDASGHLTKLLLDTGFTDQEVLQVLKKKGKFTVSTRLVYPTEKRFKTNYSVFRQAIQYFYQRTGVHQYWYFGVQPIGRQELYALNFFNSLGIHVCTREIKKRRFHKYGSYYFFQEPHEIISRSIVICEGPFDAINAKLYHFRDNFVLAALGKASFISCFEWVLQTFYCYLKPGTTVKYVLDSDVKRWKHLIRYTQQLFDTYNIEGHVEIYRSEKDDIADYGLLERLYG